MQPNEEAEFLAMREKAVDLANHIIQGCQGMDSAVLINACQEIMLYFSSPPRCEKVFADIVCNSLGELQKVIRGAHETDLLANMPTQGPVQ